MISNWMDCRNLPSKIVPVIVSSIAGRYLIVKRWYLCIECSTIVIVGGGCIIIGYNGRIAGGQCRTGRHNGILLMQIVNIGVVTDSCVIIVMH